MIATHLQMGARILIAEDLGPYPGTRPEINVRRLERVAVLDIGISNPVYREIMDRDQGYGCGWGDTGRLHPVSADDIKRLTAQAQSAKPLHERATGLNDASCAPCPRCGTWCCGDCEAN